MIKVCDIALAIEEYAPRALQESYDNSGLQIGDPQMAVTAVLLCLDVTEDVIDEALRRDCNLIVSHHPLLFKGLKQISGLTPTERIVIKSLRNNIAIYSAHTNLDQTWEGMSFEIAHSLGLTDLRVLSPMAGSEGTGLGVTGCIEPVPALEFLRNVKELFHVRSLRFSSQTPKFVVRKVAVCGGSGASLIPAAIAAGADAYITGDIKYHDFTTFGIDILLADIGHYESEICAKKIFYRVIHERFAELTVYSADSDRNPIGYL